MVNTYTGQSYCVVGSLLVVTVFVWAKLNIEVCLFVFLVTRSVVSEISFK